MERSKHLTAWLAICITILTMPCVACAKIIYVDDDASVPGDGSSWQTAYKYLQDALAEAKAAEKPVEICVAQGVYKPDRGIGFVRGDRRATFRLINGVTLRGGYAGLAGPDPNARDVKEYESVLSGDLQDNDPEVEDLADLLNVNVGNSRTVVTGSGTDSTAVLDGFTVTRGYFNTSYLQPDLGAAGMYNLTGSPTVLNCTFTRNASQGSGAMCNRQGSNPMLIDCIFTRNYAFRGGAGIANRKSNPRLVGCIFRGNASLYSAAMYNRESSPVVDTCTFVRNSGFEGGAIYNLQSSPTLIGCLFQENTASVGGAVFNDEGSTLTVNACIFTGNSAMYGGAVNDRHPSVNSTISNCIFRMNLASRYAGALFVNNASVTNCIFAGNRALRLPPDPEHPSVGGAILTSTITLTNCTFDGNWAEFGRAIFGSRVSAQAYDCIFWGSEDLIYCDYLAPPIDVRYSNIQHGWPGEGNIDTDPCFVRLGRWADPDDPNRAAEPNDPNAIWVDGDYHLKSPAGRWDPATESWVVDDVTSPCIDAGDPNAPVGYEPLPDGDRINMGAYGGTLEASKSTVQKPVVSRTDLLQALRDSHVGSTGKAPTIGSEFGWVDFILHGSGCYFQVSGVDPNDPAAVALRFVETWQDLFMAPSGAVGFEVAWVMPSVSVTTVRLRQTYAGLEVCGADITVEVKLNEGVTALLASIMTDASALDHRPDTIRPSLDVVTAQHLAEAYMERRHAGTTYTASAPVLMIFPPRVFQRSGDPRPVWYTVVHEVDGHCGDWLYLDARSGAVVLRSPLCIQ